MREILVNPNVAAPARSPLQRTQIASALVVTSPLWLSLTLVVMLARAIQSAVLYGVAWAWIGGARRRVIFVYSDSPNWKTHVEVNIQPRLPQKSIVLNWSQRAVWKRFDVPVLLFRRFAGTKEFNPIGLVFERFRPVKRFRFWQPFRDDRHGKPEALQLMEKAFLDAAL